MDTNSMRNMCSVVDAIEFIIRHEDKLTSTERVNLTDPLNVSRALFRRILGKTFAGFEIRKNSEHYSIRCDDADMYKMLYMHTVMYGRNGSYLDRIERSVYQQLRDTVAPLNDFFSSFSGQHLSYKFRDENRFFIYVSYMPYTHHFSRDFSNQTTFGSHNLSGRLDRLTRMYAIAKDIKPTPLVTKFLDFLTRFGQWSLGYLPRTMGAGSVTEEFMDYALAAPRGDNLQTVANSYVASRRQIAEQEQVRQQEIQRAAEAERRRQQEQRNVAPDDAQQRFRDALARFARPAEETAEAVAEEVQPVAAPMDAFNAALARIRMQRGEPTDERFLRLRLDNPVDIDQAQVMIMSDDEPTRRRSIFDPPEQMPFDLSHVSDNEYIRLLRVFSQHRAEAVFSANTQDVFDDLDTERHGVYFMVEGTGLKYLVYGNGQLLLDTPDYDAAMALYTERYGRPGEIRYLEEISHARNEH